MERHQGNLMASWPVWRPHRVYFTKGCFAALPANRTPQKMRLALAASSPAHPRTQSSRTGPERNRQRGLLDRGHASPSQSLQASSPHFQAAQSLWEQRRALGREQPGLEPTAKGRDPTGRSLACSFTARDPEGWVCMWCCLLSAGPAVLPKDQDTLWPPDGKSACWELVFLRLTGS